MSDKLPKANTLPFVGFVTPDLKWVAGFSGGKATPDFLKVLDEVDRSPMLEASPAVRKKLGADLASAKKAAEKQDWKAVLKAGKDAAATTGRCEERDGIQELVVKAHEAATASLDGVVKSLKEGGDRAEARKTLGEIIRAFAGEAESEDAKTGLKAVEKLTLIASADAKEAGAGEGIRKQAAGDFGGSRWAKLFE